MVPLVPVDQLPYQLQGIPRQLTHRQISDGAWKLCSETDEIPSALLIQAPTASFSSPSVTTTKARYLAPDHHVRAEPQKMPASDTRSPRLPQHLPARVNSPEPPRPTPIATSERPSSLTDTFTSIYQKDTQRPGYRVPHPSGIEPDPSKKEYCTHWIKTGECDWTAFGCKFKHEMPGTEKLRELGFVRGIPKWWKEKSAIVARPPTWMQRRLAANEDADHDGAMPEARAFPDPSTFRTRKAEQRDLLGDEVQPRGILKMIPSPRQATSGRLTPPPAPVQELVRRATQVSDLLIDLDDTPAPPPSPESSRTSAASSGSSKVQISCSRTSSSSQLSPSIECKISSPIDSKSPPKAVATKKTPDEESTIWRHPQLSWASDTEDDTPAPTKPTTKAPRPAQQRGKPAPCDDSGRPVTASTTPTKHCGLAASKHATHDHAVKDGASRSKNANRRKYKAPREEQLARELHAQIETLWKVAHQKDRAKKSATTAVHAAGRRTAV